MALRIVLVGQAAFGEKTLERLAKRHEVVAAYCPPDPLTGKRDPLKERALAMGVPVLQPKSMKSDEVYEGFRAHRADVGVLAFVTVIVPERVIAAPKLGTLCFHPSLLPRYRGGSAINWQIIRGETEGGLTVFWTDAGIDTGPILLQKKAAIGLDDTTGSFYYEKIFPLGIDAMEEAVDLVDRGIAPRIPQDESQASYDPLCRDEHVGIDWSRPARQVYDLVRGADPQPGAWALRGAEPLRFYDCRLEPEEGRGAPGELIAVEERGALVGLAGGVLVAARLRHGDSPRKSTARELAAEGKIAAGDRLRNGGADA
ncbi:MAG: methionyl-tRNA formyltransferase [Candidatus Binatia bacterium]